MHCAWDKQQEAYPFAADLPHHSCYDCCRSCAQPAGGFVQEEGPGGCHQLHCNCEALALLRAQAVNTCRAQCCTYTSAQDHV